MARAAWPALELPFEAFAARLTALTAGLDPAHARQLFLEDLYLAWACAAGVRGAHEAFERAVMTQLPRHLARFRRGPTFEDDVTELVRERLLVGDAPRIGQYGGRGPLAAWVRVTAIRIALDWLRGEGSRPEDGLDAMLPPLAAAPDLEVLKQRYREGFQNAIDQALEGLSPRQRRLLRMHHVDRFTLDRLATMYGVHRASVARWLAEAREQVVRETHRLLGERFALSPSEVDDVVALINSQLALSVTRLASRGSSSGSP